ncbi:GNAT family N-acetyltransferase [Kitasatospora sp. NBC_00240]|uniref:GNAT family N-acetyltransferase n=1 Tax=Kitasatospora sp. NBC_00240 TaxID=2903567 RepID=UPI00224F6B3B|nr:GNAT family N-acetyltransferase [Kitasatospora sp. NBC_00240]MCX5212124.1 GNAT family N-acetyltransferase [Kitasatospora sp. NBC_00240]
MTKRSGQDVTIRVGSIDDAEDVAALHAESWRTAYAGIVPDRALGDGLAAERGELWTLRLGVDYGEPANTPELLIAETAGETVGFAYLVPQPDGRILLDNLHVRPGRTGGGTGGMLMRAALAHVARRHPGADLYLEVLRDNTRAVAFYEREGGRRTGARQGFFPGGFTLPEYEYTWAAQGARS